MAGSAAEERIRAKAEALLRERYPDARIVHELVLDQWGVRIDLAAVRPDELIAVEIKSERDVTKRLSAQVTTALKVAQRIWVCAAPKHEIYLRSAMEAHRRVMFDTPRTVRRRGTVLEVQYKLEDNPDHIPYLASCSLLIEVETGFEPLDGWRTGLSRRLLSEPAAQLQMLWAEELRTLCGWGRLGVGSKTTRTAAIELAAEHMTGGEIRKGVCTLLRQRPFPRADAPIVPASPKWAPGRPGLLV